MKLIVLEIPATVAVIAVGAVAPSTKQ